MVPWLLLLPSVGGGGPQKLLPARREPRATDAAAGTLLSRGNEQIPRLLLGILPQPQTAPISLSSAALPDTRCDGAAWRKEEKLLRFWLASHQIGSAAAQSPRVRLGGALWPQGEDTGWGTPAPRCPQCPFPGTTLPASVSPAVQIQLGGHPGLFWGCFKWMRGQERGEAGRKGVPLLPPRSPWSPHGTAGGPWSISMGPQLCLSLGGFCQGGVTSLLSPATGAARSSRRATMPPAARCRPGHPCKCLQVGYPLLFLLLGGLVFEAGELCAGFAPRSKNKTSPEPSKAPAPRWVGYLQPGVTPVVVYGEMSP